MSNVKLTKYLVGVYEPSLTIHGNTSVYCSKKKRMVKRVKGELSQTDRDNTEPLLQLC